MLARWKREAQAHGKQAFPGNGNPRDAEIEELRRELEQVSRERDILKKAVGIFSRHQP
jgi:transposase